MFMGWYVHESDNLKDVSGVKYRFYVTNDLSGNENWLS